MIFQLSSAKIEFVIGKIFKFLVLGMTILLPFEYLGTFEFGGYTVKLSYIIALILTAVVASVLSVMPWRGQANQFLGIPIGRTKLKFEEWVLLALVLWSFASVGWSLAPKRTLVASALMLLMAIIFMIIRRITDKTVTERIKLIFVYSGIVIAIFAIYQLLAEHWLGGVYALLRPEYDSHVFGFARPEGTFIEPLYLANFLIWPIVFQIQKLVPSKPEGLKIKNQNYRITILIILLIAFILTLSRGAYLGLGLAVTVVFLLLWFKKVLDWNLVGKIVLSILIAIILAGGLIFAVSGTAGIKTFSRQALRSTDLNPGNEVERLKNREVSASGAKAEISQHTILGIGLDAFGALPQYRLLRDRGDWQTVNNEYLDMAVSLGLIGLLVWTVVLMLLLRYFIFERKAEPLHLIAVLALLIQWTTFSALNLLYIWVGLGIIWPALSKATPKEELETG